jgi:hypothetical protein
MGKVIRLTESDLRKFVAKIIKEQIETKDVNSDPIWDKLSSAVYFRKPSKVYVFSDNVRGLINFADEKAYDGYSSKAISILYNAGGSDILILNGERDTNPIHVPVSEVDSVPQKVAELFQTKKGH